MTVSSTTIKTSPYSCDGATVDFAFSWAIWDSAEVKVILRTVLTGAETVLTETTHYSVTLSTATPSSGYITTVATYSAAYEIVIKANFPNTQEVDYGEGDTFPASSHEEALDRGVRIVQQLREMLSRAVLFPESTILEDVELPEVSASNINYYLKVNNAGSAIEWASLVDYGDLLAHDAKAFGAVHTTMISGHNTATDQHTGIFSEWSSQINTLSAGLGIIATAAEVAAGSETTKIVSPSGLASVWQYETLQVPAGSLRPAVDNAGTQGVQEYGLSSAVNNSATVTRDYVEFGDLAQSGNESVGYDVTLLLPEQWDRSILKAKLSWMAGYDKFVSSGSAIAIGMQIKAYNSGSPINVNWSTPPVYVTGLSNNSATNIEWDAGPSANIASAVAGSLNRLDVRFTRKNSDANNATAPIWLTQALFQYRKNNQCSGW